METAENATRCPWCGTDPLYVAYHDTEWGRPERDGRKLFPPMGFGYYAGLSPTDMQALIAYIRTLPPIPTR